MAGTARMTRLQEGKSQDSEKLGGDAWRFYLVVIQTHQWAKHEPTRVTKGNSQDSEKLADNGWNSKAHESPGRKPTSLEKSKRHISTNPAHSGTITGNEMYPLQSVPTRGAQRVPLTTGRGGGPPLIRG